VTPMSTPVRIDVDLYSDTVSQPTADMRRFMCEAPVGDEQKFEDPTVNQLCEMVAELLGKEAAVFMPSGTMCNEIALRVHARHGEEVIAHRSAHPINSEAGGPAALAGVNVRAIDGPRGQFDVAAVEAAIRPRSRYAPRTRLLWVEQTSNHGGGSIWSLARIEAVTAVARHHGLATHMDGARLMNAVVASGVSARDYSAFFDSVWIDFTKGLGAPVGACLAGSAELIEEAWRWKQMLGGAMRQSGVLAPAGLYALDNNVDRLADDHNRARRLVEGLAEIPGIQIEPAKVETNIVIFEVPDAEVFVRALESKGVRMGALDARRVRAVTHLDVDDAGIDQALEAAQATVPAGVS
jgi:threonine aldolase